MNRYLTTLVNKLVPCAQDSWIWYRPLPVPSAFVCCNLLWNTQTTSWRLLLPLLLRLHLEY